MILIKLFATFCMFLLWIGPPVAAFIFMLLVAGRRIGGKTGMKIAVAFGMLSVSMPLLWIVGFYAIVSLSLGHLTPLFVEGIELLPLGGAMVLSALAVLPFIWTEQAIKAEERAERRSLHNR